MLFQKLENPLGLLFVDARQGEADVNEDVVAGCTSGTCSRQTRLQTPPKSTLPISTSCSR